MDVRQLMYEVSKAAHPGHEVDCLSIGKILFETLKLVDELQRVQAVQTNALNWVVQTHPHVLEEYQRYVEVTANFKPLDRWPPLR